ncbi:MAG: hypothetical protein EBU80_11300 [Chitinophagia bacterium]|nr:hypothetical protein [Chitinophagia bacterium]
MNTRIVVFSNFILTISFGKFFQVETLGLQQRHQPHGFHITHWYTGGKHFCKSGKWELNNLLNFLFSFRIKIDLHTCIQHFVLDEWIPDFYEDIQFTISNIKGFFNPIEGVFLQQSYRPVGLYTIRDNFYWCCLCDDS